MQKTLASLAFVSVLTACGGGGGGTDGSTDDGFVPGKTEQTVTADQLNQAITDSGSLELTEGTTTTVEGDLVLTSNQSLVVKGDLVIK